MNYHKPSTFARSCVLFGSLFSFNVVLSLGADEIVLAKDSVYLYDVVLDSGEYASSPVDPLNPDSAVVPVPPEYTTSEEYLDVEEKEPEKFSVLPPDGKKPIKLPSVKKEDKSEHPTVEPQEVHRLDIALNSEEQDQSMGGGGSVTGHSYLGEMFGVLSGKMLFGREDSFSEKRYLDEFNLG